jgi:hypothetical protein
MNNFKNLLIAILIGLLGLSLFTLPAQGAGKSKEAKMIEYARCLELVGDLWISLDTYANVCAKYRP